ncbi:MAG: DUF2269 family protein [Actinomycetota bacterium]|nr:DUF2269 family protein [Actinomycetota bacterium]
MYNFWQFLHVTAAVTWVGAGILSLVLSLRLTVATDNPIAAPANGLVQKTAVPLFMAASLSTLITGLILAFGWIGFGPLWIKIGLGGIVFSLVMGWGYHRPHGAKIESAIQERGPSDPSVLALIRQGNVVSIVEIAILIFVIWAMVTKP